MIKLLLGLGLGLGLVSLTEVSASAHEQAIGFAEVNIVQPEGSDCSNADCRVEVAHRLVIHDAESTLMNVLGARADLYGDRVAQTKLEAYVASRFSLTDPATGEPVDLKLLGGEVERGFYWVYLEGETPADTAELDVSNTVMMDVVPNQTNRVNIRRDGETRTLVFRGASRAKSYRIR